MNNISKKETKQESFRKALLSYGDEITSNLYDEYKLQYGAETIVPYHEMRWMSIGEYKTKYIFEHFPKIKEYYDEDNIETYDKESLTNLIRKYFIFRIDDFIKSNKDNK